MKKSKIKSKNFKLACEFWEFCMEHPELRFWQALRAWVKVDKVHIERFEKEVDDVVIEDTFYFKGKTK